MGTHLRILSKGYSMNTSMTGFRWLSKILHPFALDESSLIIGRVNIYQALHPNLQTSKKIVEISPDVSAN